MSRQKRMFNVKHKTGQLTDLLHWTRKTQAADDAAIARQRNRRVIADLTKSSGANQRRNQQ